MERVPELGVLAHAIAVAADRDQVTVVDEEIDGCGGHDLVAEDFRPIPQDLTNRLQSRGVRVWLDAWVILGGDRWQERIVEGIKEGEGLVLGTRWNVEWRSPRR